MVSIYENEKPPSKDGGRWSAQTVDICDMLILQGAEFFARSFLGRAAKIGFMKFKTKKRPLKSTTSSRATTLIFRSGIHSFYG